MAKVMFYHLTRSGVADVVRLIAPRAQEQGWRVMVRATSDAAVAALDQALWLPEESFFPHGVEGGPHDAVQPVLIGRGARANGARGLFLIDGATVDLDEARALERVWLLFDGADPTAVEAARAQWRAVSRAAADGLEAEYWAEEGGRWQKKA